MTRRTASDPSDQPLAVSLTDAARRLGLGLGTVRALVADGRLPVVRVGRRVLVPVAGIVALLDEPIPHIDTTNPRPEPGVAHDLAPTISLPATVAAPAPHQEPACGDDD